MKIKDNISEAKVYHEFLQTEWYKGHFRQFEANGLSPDKLSPDDPADIETIKQLLSSLRSPLLSRLPTGINWHRAQLDDGDFEELLVIRECPAPIFLNT